MPSAETEFSQQEIHLIRSHVSSMAPPVTSSMVQQESKIMPLSVLTDKVDRPRIVARVLKIWHACSPLNARTLNFDFTLVDAEGTLIQGTMSVDDSHVILQQMHEENVYEFYLFRVIPARKKYSIVKHEWQLKFNRAVLIKPVSDRYPEIPLRCFNFCVLEELGKQIGEDVIVDAIGRVNWLSPVREVVQNNVVSYVRTLEIANERNTIVPISIWGEHIKDLKEDPTSYSNPSVVAFSSLRLRRFPGRGIWGLKTYSATRIYQDRKMPEITQFEKRISAKLKSKIAENSENALTYYSTHMNIVKLDYLLSLDPEQEKSTYKCVATVDEVLGEHDWYYKSCPRDKKRLLCEQDGYMCPKCHFRFNEEQTVPRLRLCISVKDSTASADFVILDKRAEHLLGTTTQELLHAQSTENESMPSKIQALVNQTVLFTVRCCAFPIRYNRQTFNVFLTYPVP